MMRVKGLTGPQADSVHRIRGLMAPQTAGRRPPWTQLPLRGVRFTWTTSPREPLGSWLVKTRHWTRMGYG